MADAPKSLRSTVVATYLAAQGAATLLWWTGLLILPSVRSYFELDRRHHNVLNSFSVPDLTVFMGGSLLAAIGARRSAQWSFGAVAMTAGAAGYATLYLMAWVAQDGSGWAGLLAMVPATVITTGIAWRMREGRP